MVLKYYEGLHTICFLVLKRDVYKRQALKSEGVMKKRKDWHAIGPVSYTHLDVYKRQSLMNGQRFQIDYFLIQSRFKNSLKNARAYRGADINSDHK